METFAKLLDLAVFKLMALRIKNSLQAPYRDNLERDTDASVFVQPEIFYAQPEAVPLIDESWTFLKQDTMCDIYDFQFPSAVTSPWPENNTVYGRYFKASASPGTPTVIVLHGWLAFSYIWFASICRKLAQAGLNSLLIQIPFHMKRQPRGSRFSGEFSVNGEPQQTVEMIRQAVSDVRSVINWVKANPTSWVGIWGISLGGWIGSLVTAVEPRLDFSVLMIPAVRPDDIIWHSRLVPPVKHVMVTAGISYEEIQDVLKIVTPKYFDPQLPPEKILLIEAEYDLGIRPHTVEELWEAWGRPHLRRYPHSHMSIVMSRRAIRDGMSFILNSISR